MPWLELCKGRGLLLVQHVVVAWAHFHSRCPMPLEHVRPFVCLCAIVDRLKIQGSGERKEHQERETLNAYDTVGNVDLPGVCVYVY